MIRLAVAAAFHRRCGVGDFARRLVDALPPEIEVTWIDYPERDARAAWRRAARCADGLDVVHVHYEYGLFGTVKPYRNKLAAFLDRLRPPAVVTLHGALPRLEPRWRSGRRGASDLVRDLAYLPFFTRWERMLCRGGRHWIAHGLGVHEQIARVVGAERATYMPHPVPDIERRWRSGAGAEKVIVTPGFVKPHKGYRELARALANDESWSWVVAGGPQDRTDEAFLHLLRGELVARGLVGRVRVTGYLERSDMEAALCGAAMAVFPHREVAGSGSVAWAIGCGVPVVTTDLPEFRALRSRGAGIELLPIASPERWAGVLDRLWGDPSRLAELARRNRGYAAANGFEACGRAHAAIFSQVVEEVRR